MGCDIHSFAEVKRKNKWEKVGDYFKLDEFDRKYYKKEKGDEPFGWRSYSLFAFLADVRNYDHCEPLSKLKGLPKNSEWLNAPCKNPSMRSYETEKPFKIATNYDDIYNDWNYHSLSYLTLKEFVEFDYEKKFWNRRVSKQVSPNHWNGASLAEEGEGKIMTYKENLGQSFFDVIEQLKELGEPENVRVVFWFDN